MKKVSVILALVVCLHLACCGESPPVKKNADESADDTLSVPSRTSGYTGAIEGRVVFQGAEIPRSTRVLNTTDPHLCGTTQSLHNVLISPDRGVRNVVISLGDVVLPEGYTSPTSRLVLDNRDCQFEPHVAVLTAGSEVETTNSDAITHTVHFYGLFNLNVALGPNQSKFVRRLERPGWYIVKCDLHGWMQAYVRVDDHPFHAVSTESGDFRIDHVPPGAYKVNAWHEYFGRRQQEVVVETGSISTVTITYENRSPG